MYSARAVNCLSSGAIKPPSLSPYERIPARESTLPGMGGVLSCRSADFSAKDRVAWLFISIKNRGFSKRYVNRFVSMCEAEGVRGHICPVDDPYRYNAMAELKCDDLPDGEMDKIERLSSDISRMAQKAINGQLSKLVTMVKWCDIEAQTPPEYRQELTRAFKDGTRVRDHLYEHVSSVKPIETERDFERYAEFFLCEVPVLMHAYYGHGATLDIYPGQQPKFFWQIELGVFEEELPKLTAMTRRGRSMLYLDTHDRSVARPL